MERGFGVDGPLDLSNNPTGLSQLSSQEEQQRRERARQQLQQRRLREERERSRSIGELAGDTGIAALQGAVGLGQAAFGVGNLATGGLLDRATGGFSENFQETQEILGEAKSEPLQLRQQQTNQQFEEEGVAAGLSSLVSSPSQLVDLGVQAAPSLLPTTAAGSLAARTAGAVGSRAAAQQASQRAVLGTVGAQTAGATNVEAINQLRESGASPSEQQAGGLAAGAAAGVLAPGVSRVTGASGLEARVGSRLAGISGRGAGVARGAATGVARESTEEGLQGTIERGAVNLVDPETDLTEGLGRAGATGAVAGGVLGGPLGAFAGGGQQTAQPNATSEQDQTETQAAQREREVAETIKAFTQAQREGRPLQDVVSPEDGEAPSAINPQTGERETITADSFLSAQEAVLQQMFNVTEDEQGNEVITRADPDLQRQVEVPREQAEEAAAAELERLADQTLNEPEQQELPLGEPPPDGTESVEAQDPNTGQIDLFAGRGQGIGVEQRVQQPRQPAPAPQEQQELQFPPPPPTGREDAAPVDPDTGQVDLFAGQGLAPPESQQQTPDQRTPNVSAAPEPLIQQELSFPDPPPTGQEGVPAVDSNTGLVDLFAGDAAATQQTDDAIGDLTVTREESERRALQSLFQIGQDDSGNAVFRRIDRATGRLRRVPRGQALKEAKELSRQRRQEAEQRNRPLAPRWRDRLSERLGLKKQQLKGKEFNRLVQLSEEQGVAPESEGSEAFLAAAAQELGADETAGRLGASLGEAFGVEPGAQQSADTTSEQGEVTDADVEAAVDSTLARPGSEGQATNESAIPPQDSPTPVESQSQSTQAPAGDNQAQVQQEQEESAERALEDAQTPQTQGPDIQQELVRQRRQNPTTPLGRTQAERNLDTVVRTGSLDNLNKATLQDDARENGLPTRGNKTQLKQRLRDEHDRQQRERVAQELGVPSRGNEPTDVEINERAQEAAENIERQQASDEDFPVLSDEELQTAREMLVEETNAEMRSQGARNRSKPFKEVVSRVFETADTAESLDMQFQAVKDMQDFKDLQKSSQEKLIQQYSDRFDALSPGKFKRVDPNDNTFVDYRTRAQREEDEAEAQQGTQSGRQKRDTRRKKKRKQAEQEAAQQETDLTRERASEIVANEANEGSNTRTPARMFDTVAEFREETGQSAPPDAAGVFDDNGVSVILENTPTEEKLTEVLAHERGHESLQALLGDRLPAVTNRLWANASLRKRIRSKMQQEGLDRATGAEEVLVDMLAAQEKLNSDILSKLRSGIESFFQTVLGVGKYRITDSQVNRLLADTGQYLRTDTATHVGQTPLATDEELTIDQLLGDPEVVTAGPRFSRVYQALNEATPARGSLDERKRQFSGLAQEAVQASVPRLRDIQQGVRSGRFGREVTNFVPLNQIFNLHGRRFERVTTTESGEKIRTNPLRDVRDVTDRQEAGFNQRLTQKRKLELDGEQFSASIHDITDEATRLQTQEPEAAKNLNQVLQFSTFYQTWPQKAWEDQVGVDYEQLNMTETERRAAHDKLRQLYDGMGENAQTLYRKIQASYKDQWESRLDALETALRAANGGELPSQSIVLESARRRIQGGPYSPLSRSGRHQVLVRDSENNIVYSSAHDTESEAENVRAQMHKSYPFSEGFQVTRDTTREELFGGSGLTTQQADMLERILENELPPGMSDVGKTTLRNALIETYLKSQPEGTLQGHSMRRQNIDGFSMDGIRAFSDHSLKAARQISSTEFDHQLGDAFRRLDQTIRDMQQEGRDTAIESDVRNKVVQQHEARVNKQFSKLASQISGAGFLYMMTSPSQMFVNASQTPLVAFPTLAARYNGSDAARFGMEAMRNFFSGGRDFNSQQALDSGSIDRAGQQVMQRLFEEGVLDFTLAHDIAGVARGEGGQLDARWRKTMNFASHFIHHSEVFNRQVTAYMSTRLEMKRQGIRDGQELTSEQLENLTGHAKDAVYDTQFNYSQSNKPAVLQGPIRNLVGQFQQFRLNMLAMYAKNIRDSFGGGQATQEDKRIARRTLAYLTGSQLAFTGATGTAFSPIVFGIMDAFFDDEDEGEFVDSRTAFVQQYPNLLTNGVVGGVLQTDTQRIGAGTIIPWLGDRKYEPNTDDPKEVVGYHLERNIGPWFGLIQDAAAGTSEAMNGNYLDATRKLLPKPMADGIQAVQELDGEKDDNGVVTYDTGAWDTVNTALGMRSQGEVDASERRGAGFQAQQRISQRRRNMLVRYAAGVASGDRTLQQEALAEIQEWNQNNPTFAVTAQDIGRLRTRDQRKQQNLDETGLQTSRTVTPAFQRATGAGVNQ